MKTISLRKLVLLGIVQSISSVRFNTNGYAYVTMVRKNEKGETESHNVYFPATGETSAIVNTWVEGDKVIGTIANWELAQVENAQGEIRFKLYKPSEKYASAAEMMELFGVEETQTDFDIELFQSNFATKAPVEDPIQQPNPAVKADKKLVAAETA